ncbi:MAG: hypothetical protein COT18_03775 [Elusimicrobia bacterium CG08_land_8_20_14_0_20_59_10]|nr:MAG: hypothetical protein COT18_03775 [Elusimicrobia bacterium CG08_land_8_20_14_0_20_59_10]
MTGRSILVIDDEVVWHKLLKRFFGNFGYRVYAAANCAKGIKLAGLHKPDCIILDFHLTDGDAVSVCSVLRKNGDSGKIPVIIFSSDPAAETEAYSRCGAENFVLKGAASLAALRKAVEVILPPTA